MSQIDALAIADSVRDRLVDFAIDSNFSSDPALVEICRRIWSGAGKDGGLVGDLWVEGVFPAKTGDDTLASLARKRVFGQPLCDHLDRRGVVPKDRPLYSHQQKSIEICAEHREKDDKPGLVVTAGTGAGKTEAFLLPILDDLFSTKTVGRGVRCLILYPMNALVNDQVDRLYNWMIGQDEVTLFHFTGETQENKRYADQAGVPNWEPCRFRTRQEARGLEDKNGRPAAGDSARVPDILITNYSMLEYMLCRPQDSVFFGQALRAVVLDEAHLYTGTLAAEISLLLRRLLLRCGRRSEEVMHFATSATLGSSKLREFGSSLFSKPERLVEIVKGESTRVPFPERIGDSKVPSAQELLECSWPSSRTLELDGNGKMVLAKDLDCCMTLRESLTTLVPPEVLTDLVGVEHPAVLCCKALRQSELVRLVEQILWDREQMPLSSLAEALWGKAEAVEMQAVILLLKLGSIARNAAEEYPLLPHRIHLMTRPPDGLVVCVDPDCTGDERGKLSRLGSVHTGFLERCPDCGGRTLTLYRCTNCGTWVVGGQISKCKMSASPFGARDEASFYTLGGVASQDSDTLLDVRTGEVKRTTDGAIRLRRIDACPKCGSDAADFRAFSTLASLTLSIIAETLVAELPPLPDDTQKWLPAQGRRLLAFSDSRQSAARLGPRLTRQHEAQLIRAAILERVESAMLGDASAASALGEIMATLRTQLNQPGVTPSQEKLYRNLLAEHELTLAEYEVGGSIEDWSSILKESSRISEILDRDTSSGHSALRDTKRGPRRWSQHDFERNRDAIRSRVKHILAREFARPSRREASLETLGLVEVTYPGLDRLTAPPQFLGMLPTRDARDTVGQVWTDFMASLCDTVRSEGAITLTGSEEFGDEYWSPTYVDRWCAESEEYGGRLVRFIGVTSKQRRRWFSKAVLTAAGLPGDQAEQLSPQMLRYAFRQLLDEAERSDGLLWLQTGERETRTGPPKSSVRIVFERLGLRKSQQVYRCRNTEHLWFRSVIGCAPEVGCLGTLEPIEGTELDSHPRVGRQRREYATSKVFETGLWAEEHSAQLSHRENRRLQDLFRFGVRNVLSATTTLELGIDIGGLHAVLMTNVPPGKSNYLQRAGRAGRRADGSSIAVTFCSPQPYDREVFHKLGGYLSRPLRRPLVFLDRARVVERHLHSHMLGTFFKSIYPSDLRVGAMRAFGDMGRFVGARLPEYWKPRESKPRAKQAERLAAGNASDLPWWSVETETGNLDRHFENYLDWVRVSKPDDAVREVDRLLNGTALEGRESEWEALVDSIQMKFRKAIDEWLQEYTRLLEGWEGVEAENRPQANAIRYQLKSLYDLTVIEALADSQFLPHYGFPIGLHKLRVIAPDAENPAQVREEDQYRLERGNMLAMREYVPGSQLMVGGKTVTSHGILKHWTGENIDSSLGLRGQCCECKNKHFYYWITDPPAACPVCGDLPRRAPTDLLFPKHGFSSAAWDPPKWGTDTEVVGEVQTATLTFATAAHSDRQIVSDGFGDVPNLTARYQENGELLVYNEGENGKGFVVCLGCGYSQSEESLGRGSLKLPRGFESHAPLSSTSQFRRCWGTEPGPVLRNQILSAREITDVFFLDFAAYLGADYEARQVVTTLGYALQRTGCQMLELDSREIGVLLAPSGQGIGAMLYDSVPGGAGHVRELMAMGRGLLVEARRVLYLSAEHDDRCETACLDCLLAFDAQRAASSGLLNRRAALRALDRMLAGHRPEVNAQTGPTAPEEDEEAQPEANQRLTAARERMARRTRK